MYTIYSEIKKNKWCGHLATIPYKAGNVVKLGKAVVNRMQLAQQVLTCIIAAFDSTHHLG